MNFVNKKTLVIVIITLVLVEISSLFLMYKSFTNKDADLTSVELTEKSVDNNMFAVLLQQEDGTYSASTEDFWSITGYTYNESMSGCMDMNGNKIDDSLEYDAVNEKITINTDKTAYCYLYFDKIVPAFAIYSSDDGSLTFYKNNDEVSVGNTYNGKTVTELYTDIETSEYSYASVPWYDYIELITTVTVAEEIQPISTAYWFSELYSATTFDLEKLDTSKVTNMYGMFLMAGNNATTFAINGLSNWDTSNVTNMFGMFSSAGSSATTWSIGDISNWDTSKVTNMAGMFGAAGESAQTFELDLSNWDTSNVTTIGGMFDTAGKDATTWSIGDISNWDTSNVINMSNMFNLAGYSATIWNIGDISKWDTSKVTNMSNMFSYAGYSATYTLDLSGWDVSKVATYVDFNTDVTSKVIAPTWVN